MALAGPSGAGKTTLLRLMAGAVAPDEGRVTLSGLEPASMKPGGELSRLVGLIAQQYDLVPSLSALQNVLAGRLGEWGLWRSLVSLVIPRDRGIAEDALARVGIAERSHERAGRLSGGEQQRVALARVLVQDPVVILADEPVSSLDPGLSDEMLRLLTGLADSSGRILVASHHSPARVP